VRLNSSDSRDGARAHVFVLEVVLERAHESNAGPNLVSEYKQDELTFLSGRNSLVRGTTFASFSAQANFFALNLSDLFLAEAAGVRWSTAERAIPLWRTATGKIRLGSS
jgi:hypothetical protein